MKTADIRAILAAAPDAEFAERPRNRYGSTVVKIRGLRELRTGVWTAAERTQERSYETVWIPNKLQSWPSAQIMTVTEAEQLNSDFAAKRAARNTR